MCVFSTPWSLSPKLLTSSSDVGLFVEEKLRSLTRDVGDEQQELGKLRQLLMCCEKQLSLLIQGDKWKEILQLFSVHYLNATHCVN